MLVRTEVAVASGAVSLRAPAEFELPDLAGVGDGVLVRQLEERALTTVLWDTADLRLARWGCSLSHREGEGWTVDLPAEPGSDGSRRVHRVAGEGDAVPGAALDLVSALARTAPLVPRHRLHSLRRALGLLDAEGRLIVEVDEHAPANGAAGGLELEVAAVQGGGGLVPAVVDRLEDAGATRAEIGATLAAALGEAGPPEIAIAEVGRHASAAEMVRHAIGSATVRLIRHDPGARLGDPEAVHQARVAVRRLRSDLRTFRPLISAAWSDALRAEMRWIGAELGGVRDADVLVDGLLTQIGRLPENDRVAGDALVDELRGQRLRSRERLVEALRSQRYLRLLETLVEAAHSPALLPAADRPAREVLPELMAHPWSRLRRDARRLRHGGGDDELHALRIRAKRTRYAAEAGAAVVGRRAEKFAHAVADLQGVLGEHHDAVVAAAWLREHARNGVPALAAFAAGQLWGAEGDAAERARARWPRAWKRARRRSLRRWM